MKTRSLILILILIVFFRAESTPVLFSLQALTGNANNRAIVVTPDPVTPATFGTNLLSLQPITLQPIGGVVVTNLLSWGYTVRVDGWPSSVHIIVPTDTNTWSVVALINTNVFFSTNIYIGGTGFSLGSSVPGSNGTSAVMMIGLDAFGKSTTNAVPAGGANPSSNNFVGSLNIGQIYGGIIGATATNSFDTILAAQKATNNLPTGAFSTPGTVATLSSNTVIGMAGAAVSASNYLVGVTAGGGSTNLTGVNAAGAQVVIPWAGLPAGGGTTPNAATTNSANAQVFSNTNVFTGPLAASNNVTIGTNLTISAAVANSKALITGDFSASSGLNVSQPADYVTPGEAIGLSRQSDGAIADGLYSYQNTGNVNANLAETARNDMVFLTGGGFGSAIERMRITSSGVESNMMQTFWYGGNLLQPTRMDYGNSTFLFTQNTTTPVLAISLNGGSSFSLGAYLKMGWFTTGTLASGSQADTYFITNGTGTIIVHTNLQVLGQLGVVPQPGSITNPFAIYTTNGVQTEWHDTNNTHWFAAGGNKMEITNGAAIIISDAPGPGLYPNYGLIEQGGTWPASVDFYNNTVYLNSNTIVGGTLNVGSTVTAAGNISSSTGIILASNFWIETKAQFGAGSDEYINVGSDQLTLGTSAGAATGTLVVSNLNAAGTILASTITSTNFAGNAGGLTNLNASSLSSGVVAPARLPYPLAGGFAAPPNLSVTSELVFEPFGWTSGYYYGGSKMYRSQVAPQSITLNTCELQLIDGSSGSYMNYGTNWTMRIYTNNTPQSMTANLAWSGSFAMPGLIATNFAIGITVGSNYNVSMSLSNNNTTATMTAAQWWFK